MKVKNGFLLVELMIGLLISTIFMVIITHYIIEARGAQQMSLKMIEEFSIARNHKERKLSKKVA